MAARATLPPPSVVEDSTGTVRWAGQQAVGDGTTDVLLVVRYDPNPDPFAEHLHLGDNRFRHAERIGLPFGTLQEPEEARRARIPAYQRGQGALPCIDWMLRIGRMEYDGWVSHHRGPLTPLHRAMPIFDVVDRHSGALWRLGLGLDPIETDHGFTHHWEATPQPCTYRPGDLPTDRYDAALAMTGWDKYL